MGFLPSGSVRITADGTIGTSGSSIRVYNVSWLSSTAAGILTLYNGTSASDDIYFKNIGTAEKVEKQNWTNGLLFSNGCYADLDSNVLSVIAEITKEQ